MEKKKRRYVDTTSFRAYNMAEDGNIDYQYWFDKSVSERLKAAAMMNAVAFRQYDFINLKVDRTIFSARKHDLS